jgi:hypothetical protein
MYHPKPNEKGAAVSILAQPAAVVTETDEDPHATALAKWRQAVRDYEKTLEAAIAEIKRQQDAKLAHVLIDAYDAGVSAREAAVSPHGKSRTFQTMLLLRTGVRGVHPTQND